MVPIMKSRRLLLLPSLLLICVMIAVPVSAHALLLRSNPAPNAVLATSPAQVELFFSEPVAQGLSSLIVFDQRGLQADQKDMRVDPSESTRMTVSLPALETGVYTVSWKAVSATDGHQTDGAFTFSVGTGPSSTTVPNQQTSSASLPASALISKWLLLASLALLAGRVPFLYLVWKPALRSDAGELPEAVLHPGSWTRLSWLGLGGVLLAIILGLLSQAGQVTGSELALPWAPAMLALLSTTRLGLIWLLRLTLALLAMWFMVGRPATLKTWLGYLTALALMFTVSLTSHAATESQPVLPMIDDWVHILGMTVWLGGLAYLHTGLRAILRLEPRMRTRLTSLTMGRFSGMALASVGAIGITGLFSASLRVGTFQALLTSVYGHALLFKQIFVAGLLIMAAINLLILSPRLKYSRLHGEANPTLTSRFVKIVVVEVILGALLLTAVSLLTYLPPARVNPPAVQALHSSARVDDLKMDLSISPGEVGENVFQLQLVSNGTPVTTVKQALLRFTMLSTNIAPSEGELIGQGNGFYTAKGTYFGMAGSWQVQVVVRRENKFDAYANFNFTLNNPGQSNPAGSTPRIAGTLFLLMGLIVMLVGISLHARRVIRVASGVLPLLLFSGLGYYFLTIPVLATSSLANPVPPNSQSIAAGQTVYLKDCARCHGVSGKGDGPDGLLLNPRPADLTKHGLPGVHTDAQLFDWITNGLPGTRMPAWKNKLSDTDRWNLVNYLRYLAQTTQ
jgi:copper transport protein